MSKKKPKYRVQGVSFPDEDLFQAALARAKSQRRSLSNYICGLLEADLKAHQQHELQQAVINELRRDAANDR